ncbi:LTA synthase family protein [Acutalibacter caecimuris]|uniref:LTA synthase family protein n=1 Tax=Acutalibacter caecimuris TaxID=3093657 RepID=UPI002AC8B8FA|nr:sulfatase-like hydrolase/transferase [Acutalibacter sp. M00118]
MNEAKEKLSQLCKKCGIGSLPLFFLALVFLDYAFRWVYAFAGSTRLLAWQPMLFTVGWALLLTGLVSLLPRLGRRIAMGFLGVFAAFMALLNGVIFKVFGHFFSFHDINFAGDGMEFFSLEYLRLPKKVFFILAVFLLMVAVAILFSQKPKPARRRWLRPAVSLGAVILALVPLTVTSLALTPKSNAVGWMQNYDPNDDTAIYEEFTNLNRCMKLTGLYQYTARNLAVTLGWGVDRKGIEELDTFFDQRGEEISGKNAYTDALKDKNFIMIMMESIDSWFVTEEIMPNLYRIREEALDIPHFYTPLFISAATFNTEIITQTGLIPANSGVSIGTYATDSFPLSLAHLFAKQGYSVNSYHAYNPKLYSRGTVHANLGFESFNWRDDMGMADADLDTELMNAYEQFAPVQEQPFFSFIITFSGHGPYDDDLKNIAQRHWDEAEAYVKRSGIDSSPENLLELTHAVTHMMETDQFIGMLMDRLEAEGRLDDTVLLFYTDHYDKYFTDKEFLYQQKGVSGPPELYNTPCFFYGGGLQAQEVEKYCSTVDIVPTLVNLFGLDADRRYYVGDDIFGDKGGVVMFPDGAWYDGETYFEPGMQDPDPTLTAQAKQRVSMAMEAVRIDYFKER